jgi:murein DD-endopeptidase MepM/ murein hydrolase activator NlpD
MKRPALFLFILIAAGLVIGLTLHLSDRSINLTDFHLKNAQGANRPLGMPSESEVDHRFHQFAPWQRLAQPTVNRLDLPMGSENGALTYNAQPFWAMNEQRGGHHTGDDWNGIGGMNTDLGDPVYAAADGIVVYAGSPSAGWGRVLILSHRLADGSSFQTMYAHLHSMDVALGAMVGRGQKIGSVGTADGLYPAHLHYEIRTGQGVDLGAGYAAHPLNRVDPTKFRQSLSAAPEDLRPSVSQMLLTDLSQRDAESLFNQLNNSKNREALLRILEKK